MTKKKVFVQALIINFDELKVATKRKVKDFNEDLHDKF